MAKVFLIITALLFFSGCSDSKAPQNEVDNTDQVASEKLSNEMNPLLNEWDTPYGIPPFSEIKDEHFQPAFDEAFETLKEEIAAIIAEENAPTFGNTIIALETAGKDLTRIIYLFSGLTNTDTNDTLRQLQIEIYPRYTREVDAILLNHDLFKRVKEVYDNRDPLQLDTQDSRLLELVYRDFVRSGANLDEDAKNKLKSINEEISKLTTQFSQNLLEETKDFQLVVKDKDRLAGLPEDMINAAKAKAEGKEIEDGWVFGLDRATFEGFMTFSEDREFRKQMFDGYRARGSQDNEHDNRPLVLQIAKLRAERAALLGYETHAHYQLETRMAKTPAQADEFLLKVWRPGLEKAAEEKAQMQAIIEKEGHDFKLAGHDWWHYAEKLRTQLYAFDENQVKPYFALDNVLDGAFYVANQLFGLEFKLLEDMPKWHPKVKVYEVKDAAGEHIGIFLADFYSRDSKRGGAWMSAFRSASNVNGNNVRPLITNNLNLTPPAEGDPTLLSFDQVNTLFHEFGHALHGLMTQARYERYAGTSGSPRDFTEFPAQFLEHYAIAPEVLPVYARHYKTGEVLPEELVEKLQQASTHNQGFQTTEFIAASLLDLAWHTLDSDALAEINDVEKFETQMLESIGLPKEIGPRYKSPYFAHIFSSPNGYSAGYYAYLWSEILDADGFTYFRKSGDIFKPELAKRLAEYVYEAGGIAPADELYRGFRKEDPSIKPLLKIRGLD